MTSDEPSFVHNEQGERSSSIITVSHDLGDRTLVVVILLTLVIGACGVQIGRHIAADEMQGQYMRDVAAKLQINTNHAIALETELETMKENERAK